VGQTSPGVAFSVAGQSENFQLALTRVTGTAGALIGSPADNVLAFADWSGTERMRINANGNVGIGLTSILAKLHIENTSSADPTSLSSVPTTNIFGMSTSPGGMLAAGIGTTGGTHIWLQGRNVGGAGVSYPIVLQPLGGNVGIGTTSPSVQLHISGTFGDLLRIEGSSTGNNTTYYSAKNGSGDLMQLGIANAGYSSGTYPAIIARGAYLYSPRDLGIIAENAFNILFQTGSSERMRITSAGNVGIGTTSPSARLGVSGSGTDSFAISINAANSTANGMTIYLPGNRSSDTTYRAISLGDDSAVRFRVFGNGNVQNTNGSYGTISDISIKENITDATVKLSDILKLKVRNFNFIGETNKQIGFIAQELEQVFPKLIDIDGETKLKSVKTSILIPMLVKSIQELSAENTSLINRIEALENK
jgi:hypothetical protein